MAERKRILSLTIMNVHSWKIWKNSPHMLSFRCFALAWVIWPLLKSNTSSLSKKTGRKRTIYTYGSEAVRLYLLQLPQELEDRHVVLTETFVSLACTNYVADKRRPVSGPLVLCNLQETTEPTMLISLWMLAPTLCTHKHTHLY